MSVHNLYSAWITTLSTSLHETMQKLYYCSRACPCALVCIVTKEIKYAAGLDHVIAELIISTFNPTTKDVFGEADLQQLADTKVEINYPVRRSLTHGKCQMLNRPGYVYFSDSEPDEYYNKDTSSYGCKYGEDWVDYAMRSYEYESPSTMLENYMAENNSTQDEARIYFSEMASCCDLCGADFSVELPPTRGVEKLRKALLDHAKNAAHE